MKEGIPIVKVFRDTSRGNALPEDIVFPKGVSQGDELLKGKSYVQVFTDLVSRGLEKSGLRETGAKTWGLGFPGNLGGLGYLEEISERLEFSENLSRRLVLGEAIAWGMTLVEQNVFPESESRVLLFPENILRGPLFPEEISRGRLFPGALSLRHSFPERLERERLSPEVLSTERLFSDDPSGRLVCLWESLASGRTLFPEEQSAEPSSKAEKEDGHLFPKAMGGAINVKNLRRNAPCST